MKPLTHIAGVTFELYGEYARTFQECEGPFYLITEEEHLELINQIEDLKQKLVEAEQDAFNSMCDRKEGR